MAHRILAVALLAFAQQTVASDKKDVENQASKATDNYDSHGCDISAGEYYCQVKRKCVTSWANCEDIHGYNDKCTARWAGLTWDLSDLQGEAFTIVDAWDNSTATFTYVFSFCGNVDLLKSDLSDYLISKCSNTHGAAGEYMSNDAPAYQTVNGKYCYRAGEDQSGSAKARFQRGNQMTWALLDPMNPAMGLELTYTGGNTCANTGADVSKCNYKDDDGNSWCQRGVRLRIACNDQVTDIPTVDSVDESADCMYTIRLNSAYGCPVECPRNDNGVVCNAKGLCYYDGFEDGEDVDGNVGEVGCACKSGHTGTDCSEKIQQYGDTFYDKFVERSVETHFWRNIFIGLFIGWTAATMYAHRARIIAVTTGVVALYAGYDSDRNISYQRVSTSSDIPSGTGGLYSGEKEMTHASL